jgi:signal transduction histidine kinase
VTEQTEELKTRAGGPLEHEIAARFGVVPGFFRLASSDPAISESLWTFARFAYLDNPLPSVFKERLFVYLSRFCEVRYCLARHLGFLIGLGYPAGDSSCLPQPVEAVLPLLRKTLPRAAEMEPLLALCMEMEGPLASLPPPDTEEEWALLACAAHVFLQTPDAPKAQQALRRILDPPRLENLNLLLLFIRSAHCWTQLHPELPFDDDLKRLLTIHEAIAKCIFDDPEAHAMETQLPELGTAIPAAVDGAEADGNIGYFNRRAVALIAELNRAQHQQERKLDELERSNRELSLFSYAVSHDLQAPVRTVRALTQLLVRRKDGLSQDSAHVLSLIEHAADGMERLIESLLRYAQAGQGQIKVQNVPVQPLVESVRATLAPAIAESGARVVCTELPAVEADPVLLEQVIQNLVSNAILYRRPEAPPVIEVSARAVEEGWEIAVKDNGQGSRTSSKRLFSSRSNASTETAHPGQGLDWPCAAPSWPGTEDAFGWNRTGRVTARRSASRCRKRKGNRARLSKAGRPADPRPLC